METFFSLIEHFIMVKGVVCLKFVKRIWPIAVSCNTSCAEIIRKGFFQINPRPYIYIGNSPILISLDSLELN